MSGIPPVIWHFPAGELPQEPAARYVPRHLATFPCHSQQEWTGSEGSMVCVLVAWLSMNEPHTVWKLPPYVCHGRDSWFRIMYRFNKLFSVRTKWTHTEIEPYTRYVYMYLLIHPCKYIIMMSLWCHTIDVIIEVIWCHNIWCHNTWCHNMMSYHRMSMLVDDPLVW